MAQTNTHRYRLIGGMDDEMTFITEYGDICSFVGEWEETRTEYNHLTIFEAMEKHPHLDLWTALSQGEMSINDWETRPTEEEFVKDAICWLCSHYADDKWVRDDSLFPYLFATPTEQQARAALRKLGFFTDNLWQVGDVLSKVDCTPDEAQTVLSRSLTSEAVYDAIWHSIEYHAEEFGEIKKEGGNE